ncbi:hypothetical protein FPQ18DRAFT_37234 [Pyronema domesticum]|uniref:Similar to Oxysterol-binding protein-like protein 1 acc. no. O94512 n=1 Tax=Pyronema omphalodes (strain CBS 100304) TaxID=1076935 RepID=U4LES3_PYROM|nr:hypothetical protein FPQ18DRAFT_37234 [Pyronema domesticum]CCX09779.1 Similar to Oxysterol-binding protein-like protein 1; acc. no. O94512 [Pyronema omphalodes CBS 100304]
MENKTAASSTTSVATPPATPGSVTSTGSAQDNESKLKTLLSILRRFIGVTDIATVRFSLPSQLLEPIPNLEYWNYLDRPETFASIGDSDDELGRMLGVLRFWFTKDLKYVKGKPCKPYNSTLGEFFRCSWDVEKTLPPLESGSRPASIQSSTTATTTSTPSKPTRVTFLTEQTSHHPPVSAFHINCPEKGISAYGYDQISAKFTGTAIKVTPGVHNLGIFITLHNRGDEQYRLTHPIAQLGGFLRGTLAVFVEDTSFITCYTTKIRVILQYIGDSWLGKPKHRVEGVIYRYDDATENLDKIRDVPAKAVLARIEGSWMSQLFYTLNGSKEKHLIIDLDPLEPVPKVCPPMETQLPNESRKKWGEVTDAIIAKDYAKATQVKTDIEERQRERAAERVEKATPFKPRFFQELEEGMELGKPVLSEEGKKVLEGMEKGEWKLEEYPL